MNWYQKSVDEVLGDLGASLRGLTTEEADRRLHRFGPNELLEKKKKSPVMMFLDQFKDFMILVLIAAALISGIIGEASDTVAIIVILVLNAVIGLVQEYRAEKAMAALKKLAAPSATIIRDGAAQHVPASRIVPGDVVLLEAGQVVPADIRLSEAAQLRIEEATLTGESVPAEKCTTPLRDGGLALGDRKNMAFKGTFATYGRATGIVVATGMDTELGKIATMIQEEEGVKTPLQKRLARFGQKLAIAVLVICAIVFGIGLARGEPTLLMLLTAISLAVAAIPEALPAVVTISLALGAKKMVTQNALIRKLPAVETLGSVTYICSDKTGTLTLNKMTVETVYEGKRPSGAGQAGSGGGAALLTALALSNDALGDPSGVVIGDPTEVALYTYASRQGYDKVVLEQTMPRLAELPFDSHRKCMTTFHRWRDGRLVSFTKGAPDVLIHKLADGSDGAGLKALDAEEMRRANESMSAEGLRVLAMAMRTWDTLPSDTSPEHVEAGLTFLGLVGMMDPPREEVKGAVALCKTAGIRPVMITGDHPLTAKAIAKRLGMLEDDAGAVLTGKELDELALEEFEERVQDVRVYARVAPEQKLKIVRALQDKGQVVAMTGDGVNDAPALKRADIGVAMGITGTDVSKEAAHMLLLDDNFATIVKAVKEGRKIYDNIRKFVKYLLTTNSGELWTLFLAPLFGLPIPLLPIHILWINLVTDGLPALALAAEPAEDNIMSRPPRHPKESIFAQGLGLHALWVGLLMAAVVLAIQAWAIHTGCGHWQTMVFTALCLTQLGHVLAIRSEKHSLFTMGLLSNKYVLGAVVLTFMAQMVTVYAPFLNGVFRTQPLTLNELAVTLALSTVVFIAVEVEKLVRRRHNKPRGGP